MIRSLLILAIGIGLGLVGMAAAHLHEDGESVRLISARDIKEKLDGKDAKVTVVEVTHRPRTIWLAPSTPGAGVCVCAGR